MKEQNNHYFNSLKQKVVETFLQQNNAPEDVKSWSGEDIELFREDLRIKVNSSISEKWFYSYFKNDPKNLPRIDILNLLSKYANYTNWNHFKSTLAKPNNVNSKKKKTIAIIVLVLLATLIFTAIGILTDHNDYRFCFVDEDKGTLISDLNFRIEVIKENETSIFLNTDESGCFNYSSSDDAIHFVVSSPYHITDTIIRSKKSNGYYNINVKTDYYALMLEFFANGDKKQWDNYRKKLDDLILDDAIIYELYPNNIGVEIYTKQEFIQKLTIPTTDLKKIKVIEKSLKNDKINNLKFMIK